MDGKAGAQGRRGGEGRCQRWEKCRYTVKPPVASSSLPAPSPHNAVHWRHRARGAWRLQAILPMLSTPHPPPLSRPTTSSPTTSARSPRSPHLGQQVSELALAQLQGLHQRLVVRGHGRLRVAVAGQGGHEVVQLSLEELGVCRRVCKETGFTGLAGVLHAIGGGHRPGEAAEARPCGIRGHRHADDCFPGSGDGRCAACGWLSCTKRCVPS